MVKLDNQFYEENQASQDRIDGKGFVLATARQFTQPIYPQLYAQRGYFYGVPEPNDAGFTEPDRTRYPLPRTRPCLIYPGGRDTTSSVHYIVRPGLVFKQQKWPLTLRWSLRSVSTVLWRIAVLIQREGDLLTNQTIPAALHEEGVGNPAPWSHNYMRVLMDIPELQGDDEVELQVTRVGLSTSDTAPDSAAMFSLSGILE